MARQTGRPGKAVVRAVLCVPPPVSPDHPLVGMATVAAVLQSRGIETEVLDLNALLASSGKWPERLWRKEGFDSWSHSDFRRQVRPVLTNLLDSCLDRPVDLIGLHVASASRDMAKELAVLARERRPEAMIIAGGPEFFSSPDAIDPDLPYDHIFLGEVEVSLGRWLDASGLRRGGAKCIPSEGADLARQPLPNYSLFPLAAYARPGVLPMEVSRGCVNHCAFCDDSRMWKGYRRKPDSRLRQELAALAGLGARHVSFCDSLLNPSAGMFHGLLRLLEEYGLPWDGMVQAREILPETARLMRRSRCAGVFVGIESFSRSFLRLLRKEHAAAHGEKALLYLAAESVPASMGLIVAGPPLQTREEFEHDLRVLARVAPSLASVAINPLCIPAGTPLAEAGESLGIKGLGERLSWKFWHAGQGIEDVRLRLAWCREAAELLAAAGVPLGANYDEFDLYLADQLRDAKKHFAEGGQ